MRTAAVVLSLLTIFSIPVAGQSDPQPAIISASGNGLVELSADFAAIVLGVQVEASTPDSAASEMALRLDRVTDTLLALGIPRDSMPTSRLDVGPRVSTVAGRRVTSYQAQSLVRLRVWDLDRVGEILSSAVAAGATNIERLDYRSTREREGRDEALRLATEEANRDARIMAEMQGMSLVRLVSSASSRNSVGFDRNLAMLSPIVLASARAAPGGIMPAQIVPIGVSVSVQVSVEWEVR